MTLVTRSAIEVFDPVTAGGAPRSADMSEVRTWGVEIERAVEGVAASGGALVFNLRSVLLANLAYAVNTAAWVVGDPTAAYNGIYLKTAGSGLGTWARVGDLPYQVITLSVGGTANNLVATSVLPVPAADRAAILIFNTPLANTGPANMTLPDGSVLPILDRYGNALTANFFAAGGAATAVKSSGAIWTFLDTDAAIARAAAEAAAAAAGGSAGAAAAARDIAVAARDVVVSRLLGEGPVFPATAPDGQPLASGARFYLKHDPPEPDDGEYVYRSGGWISVTTAPDAIGRTLDLFADASMVASGVVPISGGYIPGKTRFYRNGARQKIGIAVGAGGTLDADIIAADGVAIGFAAGVLKLGDWILWDVDRDKRMLGIAAADTDFLPPPGLTSTNTQSAIEQLLAMVLLRAPLASPALTGAPTAPTAAPGTNSPQLATTEYVDGAIAAIPPSATVPLPPGYISGCGLANNVADAVNDIDFSAGAARDSTDTLNILVAAGMTKQLDAAWSAGTNQGGLDTGAKANNSWYHCFAICKADGTGGDFLFSLSLTAPTLPATYTAFRYLGSIRTSGAGAILAFLQYGDLFSWGAVQLDLNSVTVGASAQVTLTVPPIAGIVANIQGVVAHATLNPSVYINRVGLAANANAPTARVAGTSLHGYAAAVPVNGSGQVDVGSDNPNTTVTIGTISYVNSRGRS